MIIIIIIIIIIILDNYKVIILAKNKRLLAKNRPSKTKTITFKCNLRSFACLFKFVDEWKDNDDDDLRFRSKNRASLKEAITLI